jgi:hypothetical protein
VPLSPIIGITNKFAVSLSLFPFISSPFSLTSSLSPLASALVLTVSSYSAIHLSSLSVFISLSFFFFFGYFLPLFSFHLGHAFTSSLASGFPLGSVLTCSGVVCV